MLSRNFFTLFTTLIVLLLATITSTAPLVTRGTPAPPPDPPKPANDGAGPYASQSAGLLDRLAKAKFSTIATAAKAAGLQNAARGLRHYLGNTGSDLSVSPEAIMRAIPSFTEAVRATAQNEATAAFKKIKLAPGARSGAQEFTSTWKGFYATKARSADWFFAIGGFSYAVTGEVTKRKDGGGSLYYRAHVFDRYNWDTGKSVDIGPFHFEDKELGALHLKGLAREYIVRGSGVGNTVGQFKPGTVLPKPITGGRRK